MEFAPTKFEKKEIDIESLVLDIESLKNKIEDDIQAIGGEKELKRRIYMNKELFSIKESTYNNIKYSCAVLCASIFSFASGRSSWAGAEDELNRANEAINSEYGIASIVTGVAAIAAIAYKIYLKVKSESDNQAGTPIDQV